MKKDRIFEKQNEKSMLDILYAQRCFYNRANQLEYINICISLCVCFINYFKINQPVIEIFVNGILVLINLIIASYEKKAITNGANLKKYFDYTLYNLPGISSDFEKKCKELVYNELEKGKKNYLQQINNNGKDKPPGVKDWYYDEPKNSKIELIKSMQNQNLYWDKKISKIYLFAIVIFSAVLFLLYVMICILMNVSIIGFFAGLIPYISIISFVTEKIITYFSIDKNIAIAKAYLHQAKSIEDLVEVQQIIDERRNMNFSPPNIIHKMISYKVHKKIEYINDL